MRVQRSSLRVTGVPGPLAEKKKPSFCISTWQGRQRDWGWVEEAEIARIEAEIREARKDLVAALEHRRRLKVAGEARTRWRDEVNRVRAEVEAAAQRLEETQAAFERELALFENKRAKLEKFFACGDGTERKASGSRMSPIIHSPPNAWLCQSNSLLDSQNPYIGHFSPGQPQSAKTPGQTRCGSFPCFDPQPSETPGPLSEGKSRRPPPKLPVRHESDRSIAGLLAKIDSNDIRSPSSAVPSHLVINSNRSYHFSSVVITEEESGATTFKHSLPQAKRPRNFIFVSLHSSESSEGKTIEESELPGFNFTLESKTLSLYPEEFVVPTIIESYEHMNSITFLSRCLNS